MYKVIGGNEIMTFSVDYRDVELHSGASYGFKGFFDEEGNKSWNSKIMSDEDYKEAHEWSKIWLDKIYKSKTLEDFIKGIPSKVPYSIEIKDDEIIFTWSCPNGLNGEFTFGFEVVYANIS